MKDHPGLEEMLDRGLEKGVWGTKQRSQIQSANPEGIKKLVAQQFEFGKRLHDIMETAIQRLKDSDGSGGPPSQSRRFEISKDIKPTV